MKLEINEVYHQYIVRVVIFALFTFKRQIRHPNVYKQSVYSFVEKRLPWKINLSILTNSENLSKEDERDLILEELLNDKKIDFLKYVSVVFTTPLKQDCIMEIDLTDEKKYEHFLYS
jgi:hypothetical protein